MLKRLVELTDRTCRFPGCRRRAEACDCDHLDPFDHTDPARGGLTEAGNLHCLCRRHHRLKHDAGWITARHDGTTHWLSPDSRHYAGHPEPWLDPLPPDPVPETVGDPDPPPF
ncbi:HNH endonuclease signature motif containing protein [Jatrophihabitans fulvus]